MERGSEMNTKMKLDWGLQFIGFSRTLSQLMRITVLLDLSRQVGNL
jgi:hypothetical protein